MILFISGNWVYYIIRRENAKSIFEAKSVINETNKFFGNYLMKEKFDEYLLLKLEQEYDIEKTNQYSYKITPKEFSASDFYGFEIIVDSLSSRIKYIGLYKP